jgi:FMN phosphatase YigB (HAD superfamily)
MVYVGDDLIKDVDAANKVGLHTIWMRSKGTKGSTSAGESTPDETIDDIRDLPNAIKRLIDG